MDIQLDPASWSLRTARNTSFVAGSVLAAMASADERIVVLTADLEYSNGTHDFRQVWPERFFNVGIAEHNMMTMAAGMATLGLVPYVSTFASFAALLCAEQIRTDLAYPGVKVRILAHHAGFSLGYYGTSHHATEDVGMLRPVAGLSIVAPCDAASLDQCLRQTVDVDGPVYLRLGRGRDPDVYGPDGVGAPTGEAVPWRYGTITRLRAGTDITVLAYGATVAPAVEAADAASRAGDVSVGVADVHTLKPLDAEAIVSLARASSLGLLVAEEHNVIGGLGSAVADCLVTAGVSCPLHRMGVPDEYVPVGPPTHLYRHYGLDSDGISAEITRIAAGS